MEVTEFVQALVSPAEKLIDAVTGAIGKAYEPKHTRKMADAKAYELNVIAETVRIIVMYQLSMIQQECL